MTYAKKIIQQLRGQHVRVHTMLVIGGRDVDACNVSVRLHSKGPQGSESEGDGRREVLALIRERSV